MIKDYKIVLENGSEVLYLYLNYEYEFASFFNKKKIKNIKNNIIHFISDKKIDFNGNKAVLILNGIMISSIFLVNPIYYKNQENSNNYRYSVSNKEIFAPIKIEESIKELPNTQTESLEQENVNTKKDNEIKSINKPEAKENVHINIPKEKVVNANPTTSSVKGVEEIKQENQIPILQEQIKQDKQVNIIRANGTIITIGLEEYVIGVVGAEMPASFNIEALKTQAIIARTYALRRIEEGKILTDTTINQVYKDNGELREIWGEEFDKYYNKVKEAVEYTKGEVIKYNGKHIDSVYHSTSNGMTEDPLFVWGYSIPYLKSVDSHWDLNASSYFRTTSLTTSELSIKLETEITNETPITVIDRSASNRINYIQIGDKIINGVDLYNLLGLRSRDFEMIINNDIVTINTKGYGHGVGLSQYGANGMAKEGYDYKQIINHYYNNVNIVKENL